MSEAQESRPLLGRSNGEGYGSFSGEPDGDAHQQTIRTASDHEAAQRHKLMAKTYLTIASLWVVLFMAALDGTIVVTLLGSISSSFKASEKVGWLGSSYLLSVCAFTPIYGRLSDIVGRKGALLIALTFFTLGTFLCSSAGSMNALLAARFVAGIGGGGLLTCASIVMTDLVPLRQRGLWQGITNLLFGSAAALGGPVGGFINDSYGWRTAFGIQIPFLLVGGACIACFVNIEIPDQGQSLRTKLARIDYLGSLTLISSSSCLLLGMSFLSSSDLPFTDPRVWALLLASITIAALFVLLEAKVVKEPVMPMKLLTSRSPAAVSASFFIGSFSHFTTIFHFPLWFQCVRLLSASESGLRLIPISIAAAAGSLLAGLWMKATGRYWTANLCCCFVALLSSLVLATWNQSTSPLVEYVTLVPSAFGISAVFTFMLIALISIVDKGDVAVATGTVYLFRSIGQVVGVSLSDALFQKALTAQLLERITPALLTDPSRGAGGVEELVSRIRHDASLVSKLEPIALREAVQLSYMRSLQLVFALAAALNVLYCVVCMVVEERELDGPAAAAKPKATSSDEEGQGDRRGHVDRPGRGHGTPRQDHT